MAFVAKLGGEGRKLWMKRFIYEPEVIRRLALEYFVAVTWLAMVFPADGSPSPVKDGRFWRQEPGVLALFAKEPSH